MRIWVLANFSVLSIAELALQCACDNLANYYSLFLGLENQGVYKHPIPKEFGFISKIL